MFDHIEQLGLTVCLTRISKRVVGIQGYVDNHSEQQLFRNQFQVGSDECLYSSVTCSRHTRHHKPSACFVKLLKVDKFI